MTRSKLTTQIALQSGLIVFGTMLVYALVQVGNGEGSLGSLFVRHAWHSVAIAVVVFLILQWRFQAMIYRPLETICEHGHEMSQGIFRFKHYPRTDNELEDVMQTMNFMAAHLERAQATPWKHYADSIDTFLGMIQSRKDLPIDVHAEIQMIIDNMRKMEVAVSQFHPSGTKQDGEVNGHSTKTDGCHPDSSSGVSAILQTHSKLKRGDPMGNSRSRRGGRATAQHSSSEKGNPGSNQHNVWLIAILMIFVLAVGITTGRKLQLEDQSISPVKSSGQADSSVPGYLADPANHQTHDPLWPQIKEVAQEFLCGCGQCGDMVLADCICDMPHGGIREKAFIRQQIVNGHPVEQIIAMVQEQFGRRISRPEDMELNTRLGNEDS